MNDALTQVFEELSHHCIRELIHCTTPNRERAASHGSAQRNHLQALSGIHV